MNFKDLPRALPWYNTSLHPLITLQTTEKQVGDDDIGGGLVAEEENHSTVFFEALAVKRNMEGTLRI